MGFWSAFLFFYFNPVSAMEPILQHPKPSTMVTNKRAQVCMEVDSSESGISDQEQTLIIKGHGKWRKSPQNRWRTGPLELLWKQEEGAVTMARFEECREIVQKLAFLKGTPEERSLVLQLTLSQPGKRKNKIWNLQAISAKDAENTCRPLSQSTLLDECKK